MGRQPKPTDVCDCGHTFNDHTTIAYDPYPVGCYYSPEDAVMDAWNAVDRGAPRPCVCGGFERARRPEVAELYDLLQRLTIRS